MTSCFGADILSKLIENLLNMCYLLWTWWNDLCCLFIYLFVYLFIFLFVYLFIYLFICLFIIYLFIYLFICLFIYLINNNIHKTEHTDFNSWWMLYVCKLKKLKKKRKNPWSVKIWGKWHRRIDCKLNSFSV